jgi:putative ABC transport system permease protein
MVALAAEDAEAMGGRTTVVTPLRDALLGTMKPVMTTLAVAVVLLVVIMAVNLALLMFSRFVERAPELAMRSALGATRARVLRQLLVESLAPAFAGAVLAAGIAHLAARAIIGTIPENVRIGLPFLAEAGLNGATVAVIVGLTLALAAAFGLGPAFFVTRASSRAGDVRATVSRTDRGLRRGLVTAQVALTVVLLVSSGLLVVSFTNLVTRDLGIRDPRSIMAVSAPLSGQRYEEPISQYRFYQTLIARTSSIPGVQAASVINELPGGGGGNTTFEPVDRPRTRSQEPRAKMRIVAGDYFEMMGIRIIAGRTLDARDAADAPRVAVVSYAFAKRLA